MKEQLISNQEQKPRVELPTVSQFREFRDALTVVYSARPESKASKFNQPSNLSRQALSLFSSGQLVPAELAQYYYPDVPSPVDLTELSDQQLMGLMQTFGPDLMRAKMVSQIVAGNNHAILPVGGACLLETWALDMLNKSDVCKDESIKAKTAQRLIDDAPYYTQITGTMLMGGKAGLGLMYREEFPWFLRVEQLGLPDAKRQAVETYDKMVAAQVRRGQLIDPSFTLVTLPFDALKLEEEGLLREWFDQAVPLVSRRISRRVLRYIPDNYLTAWVRYTYNGPRILDIVKDRLRSVPDINIDQFTLHVRTKQLDHLGGSTNMLRNFSKMDLSELEKLQEYTMLYGMAIDTWLANNSEQGQTGFVGFDDLSFEGDILHQTINLGQDANSNGKTNKPPKNEDELERVMTNCIRLNSNNVDQHLAFLDYFVLSESAQFLGVKEVLRRKRAFESAKASLEKTEQNERLWNSLIDPSVEKNDQDIINFINEKSKGLAKKVDKIFRKLGIIGEEEKRQAVVEALLKQKGDLFASLSTIIDAEIVSVYGSKQKQTQLVLQKEQDLEELISCIGNDVLNNSELLLQFPKTNILPLSDNIIVSHAVQLSFDPDMREFITDVVKISQCNLEERDKIQIIMEKMQEILPKMKQYLIFIMKGGAYPGLRFQRTYKPVRRSL